MSNDAIEVQKLPPHVDAAEAEPQPTWKPRLLRMSDVESKPINWLWQDRIAAGRISLLVGQAGLGKSYLTTDMAARITTGTTWPDGSPCDRGSVLLLIAEDDPADTIRPRLDAHGADVSRVHVLTGAYRPSDAADTSDAMIGLGDVALIEDALREIPDCRLIVVDPIGSFMGGRTDAHRDNEVRSVLAPIGKMAEKYGPAVLCIAHRRKATATAADDMVLGSRAFTGLARNVWHLYAAKDDEDLRLLLPGKSNLARRASGLAYRIAGDPGAICWEDAPVDMSADEALAQENATTRDGKHSAADEAESWLQDTLAAGSRLAKEVKDLARRDGIAERTLDRAAGNLGVIRGPDGFGQPWSWRLPDASQSRQDSSSIPQSRQGEFIGETDETVARPDTDHPNNGRQKVTI
ncbi:AAA family ATPase [Rosistilla oblonga]|uniref:AAA family ATPase n=1 Tax=Rosistilla oblonga TaxID=2527990 RepID=UPI003A977906